MAQGHFNGVVVLDAIPDGELNTALRVREDLRDIADYQVDGLNVLYYRIDRVNDLQDG